MVYRSRDRSTHAYVDLQGKVLSQKLRIETPDESLDLGPFWLLLFAYVIVALVWHTKHVVIMSRYVGESQRQLLDVLQSVFWYAFYILLRRIGVAFDEECVVGVVYRVRLLPAFPIDRENCGPSGLMTDASLRVGQSISTSYFLPWAVAIAVFAIPPVFWLPHSPQQSMDLPPTGSNSPRGLFSSNTRPV